MPNEAKVLARQDAHFRVMRIIETNPTYSRRDIARSLGISLGAVNYCLKQNFIEIVLDRIAVKTTTPSTG